jgi:hypothetical protein
MNNATVVAAVEAVVANLPVCDTNQDFSNRECELFTLGQIASIHSSVESLLLTFNIMDRKYYDITSQEMRVRCNGLDQDAYPLLRKVVEAVFIVDLQANVKAVWSK